MAIYSISLLLDLAHSPLVKAPEAIDAIDFEIFTAPQRPPPQREHKQQRTRNSNGWKKPAWDTQGMELAPKKQPEPQKQNVNDDIESPSRPNVELWEGNFATFQKKDGSSRFSSLFGPNGQSTGQTGQSPGPNYPLASSGQPAQGTQGQSVLGMLNKEPPPLDSMGSLQSSLPHTGAPALPPFGLYGSPAGPTHGPTGPTGPARPAGPTGPTGHSAPPGLGFPPPSGLQMGSQARSQSPQVSGGAPLGSQIKSPQTNTAQKKAQNMLPGLQIQPHPQPHPHSQPQPQTQSQGKAQNPPGLPMMFGAPTPAQPNSQTPSQPRNVSTNDVAFFNSLLTRSGPALSGMPASGPSGPAGPSGPPSGPPGIMGPGGPPGMLPTRPPGLPSNPSTPQASRPQQGQANGSPAPKGYQPIPGTVPPGMFPGFYPYPQPQHQHQPQQHPQHAQGPPPHQQPPRGYGQQQAPPPQWQRQ